MRRRTYLGAHCASLLLRVLWAGWYKFLATFALYYTFIHKLENVVRDVVQMDICRSWFIAEG